MVGLNQLYLNVAEISVEIHFISIKDMDELSLVSEQEKIVSLFGGHLNQID